MTLTLSKTQMQFCSWLVKAGYIDPNMTSFHRTALRDIARANGMQWAPAWIVKDKTRVTIRGIYSVPELAVFIAIGPQSTVTTIPTNTI